MPSFYKRHGMESRKKAWDAQSSIIHRLIESDPFDTGLTDTLSGCTPLELCKTEACPVCLLHFRRNFVDQAMRLDLPCGAWSVATIIPDGHLYRQGELYKADLPRLIRAVSKCIERSGFRDAIVFGGVDVSFNTTSNNAIGWQLEIQLMINRPCTDDLKAQVRSAFRLSRTADRPAMVKAVQVGSANFFRCLTYSYKSMFSLRSGYFWPNRRGPDSPLEKRVRDLPLKAPQAVELAHWLGQYPIGARLILRNLKRTSPPGAPLKLKVMTMLHPPIWSPVGEV